VSRHLDLDCSRLLRPPGLIRMLLGLVVIGEETKDTTVVRANRLVFSKSKKVSLLGITGGVRVLKNVFFWLDFGLSRLTSLQFILCHVAGFYKPTIPQSLPSDLRDYSTCKNARLEFSTIFISSFDPNEWCLKNGRHGGGLNPGPLNH